MRLAGIEPAHFGLSPEDEGIEQDQEDSVTLGIGRRLAARVGLQLLDRGPALALQERGHVDVGRGDR